MPKWRMLWWTSTPSIRHTHGCSNTSLECTYHLSVSINREQACELTSLYEILYSTFTDTGIGSGDDSRLSVQPGRAAIPWASKHFWIPLWFLRQQTLMARWSALTAQGALHSAVQRSRGRPRNISLSLHQIAHYNAATHIDSNSERQLQRATYTYH